MKILRLGRSSVCFIEDFDMVSDLNDGTADFTVAADTGTVAAHGDDAVNVNKGASREPTVQAKKVAIPVADAEAAPKPLSLRDQISSALKEGNADTPPAASQDGQVRDPTTGKFLPKPELDPAAVVLDPAAAPAAPVVAAPQGIDPEVFKSLPAETQASLARTMDGIAQSQQRFARLDQVEQLISPRRDAWALNGMTDAQAINQLLALSDFAGRDMPGFIQYMAQQGGVKLEDLVFEAEPVDPKYAALERQIAELQGARTHDTLQQQQAAHQKMVDNVAEFASEKGQDQQLLRPHFEELGNDVLPFISAVKAANPSWSHTQVLQEAYTRACWGSPSVRGKMQAAADAAGEAQRLRQGAEKVDKARTASVSVKNGAPTSAPLAPDNAGRSLRDTIKASIAAAS